MKVSIIILNWSRKEDTLACLRSVNNSQIKGFELEVIVVDNGSTDGSQKAVEKYFSSASKDIVWKQIENKENLGFVEGNNIGIKDALRNGSDYIILLNDDTEVDDQLVIKMVRFAKKRKKAGLISPKIYFAKGFEFHKKRYGQNDLGKVIWYAGGNMDWDNIYGSNCGVDEVDQGQHDEIKEIDFATGCCLLIKKQVFEKIGLLDKKYFLYYEDSDFSQRAKRAGWQVIYYPKAYLWHKVAQSSGIGSSLNDYFITRNRLLFGKRYAKLKTRLALMRESLKLLLTGRKWQRIGVRDYYLHRFGRGSWK